uniref:AMP-dependent synthetase/ligase domain-containing protein n=1 Tax=Peronospora matthiolae TaxID=2874970 RepID=A0AAV1U3A4_9STRA
MTAPLVLPLDRPPRALKWRPDPAATRQWPAASSTGQTDVTPSPSAGTTRANKSRRDDVQPPHSSTNSCDMNAAFPCSRQHPSRRHCVTSDMLSFTATVVHVPRRSTSSCEPTDQDLKQEKKSLTRSGDGGSRRSGDVATRHERRRRRGEGVARPQQDDDGVAESAAEDKAEEEERAGGEEDDETGTTLYRSEPNVTMRRRPFEVPTSRPFVEMKIEATTETATPAVRDGYMYSWGSSPTSDGFYADTREARGKTTATATATSTAFTTAGTTKRGSTGRVWGRALSVAQNDDDSTTIAALVTATPTTVWNTFLQTIDIFADVPAVTGREQVAARARRGVQMLDGLPTTHAVYSWAQHAVRVRCVARTLLRLGFQTREGVVICAQASPLLHAINLAAVSLGGVVAHVRSSWSARELRDDILPTAGASVVVVDSLGNNFREALEALCDERKAIGKPIRAVVVLGGSAAMDSAVVDLRVSGINVIGTQDLLAVNTPATEEAAMAFSLDSLASEVLPGQCCLLAFNYDSRGCVRCAELSHDNVIFTAAALVRSFGLTSHDRLVGYLPLHHVASQVLEFYVPLIAGLMVVCAPTYDLPLVRIVTEHKPTVFFAAPATWTRFSQQVYCAKGDVNATIYRWAKTRATNNSQKLLYAKGKGAKSRSLGYMLAKALVLNNIKKKIGLESCTACYSVLAPLDFELERLFKTVDTPIYQLFGTAETSGFAAINFPHAWEFGSSGRALPGTTIRCDERSQETVLRGRNVFLGYRRSTPRRVNQAARSGVASVGGQCTSMSDPDGWLRLWQRGFLTPTCFLKISDPRDFIVLATGDWVPIQPFEYSMMELMPELDRAMLVGDGRTFLSALLFLKTNKVGHCAATAANKHARGLLLNEDALKVSRSIGSAASTVIEAIRCQQWAVHFDTVLEKLPQVCSISGHRVRKWILMAADFTIESGELDPDTGAVCRRIVDNKYQALLDSMYS